MRACQVTLASGMFLALSLLAAGCGGERTHTPGDGDGGAGGDAGARDGSVPPGTDAGPSDRDGGVFIIDAGPRTDSGPIVACVGLPGVTLDNVIAPLHPESGTVDPATRTLVSVPRALSPALRGVTTVTLEDTAAHVRTLPVTGAIDSGARIVASVWVPSLSRLVSVGWATGPFRYEMFVTEVRADGVTITSLANVDPPIADGYQFGPLHALGASVVADRGDAFHVVAIDLAAGTASWGPPMGAGLTNPPIATIDDPAHGRIVGYGLPMFTPPMTVTITPGVATRSLPGGDWTTTPAGGGDAPMSTGFMGIFDGWLAYEPTGDRLFVVQRHTVHHPAFGDIMVPGLWSVPVAGGPFTLHESEYLDGQMLYRSPYAFDAASTRTIEPSGPNVLSRSLAMGSEGALVDLGLDGALPPGYPEAAVRIGDGRIVVSAGRALYVMDPAASAPRWESFGAAAVPDEQAFGHVLVWDAASGRVLVVGGARDSTTDPASMAVFAIAADGATGAPVVTTGGAPAARTRPGAAVVGSELVIVGGLPSGFSGTSTALADAWALDLATLRWRSVGALPAGRAAPAMLAHGPGALWVIGGYGATDFAGVSSVTSLDVATGATSPVAVTGAWPPGGGVFSAWTRLGAGVLAVDLGGTVDESGMQLWQLVPDGDTGAHWIGGDACTTDYGFYEVVGVPDPGPDGWLVGQYTWRAHAGT